MARDLLLNPLHQQAGAVLGLWRDWTVPIRFSDAEAEYRAVRERAGLLDCSTFGLVEVQGPDRIAFLQNLLSNDIQSLQPGGGCQAALLTPSAKVLADLLVLAEEKTHRLLGDGSQADTVLKTLDRYVITEAVTLVNRVNQYACFAVQGPRSLESLQRIGNIQLALQHPLDHLTVSLEGTPIWLVAHSLTGATGVLLIVQAEHAAWLWDLLVQHGRSHGLIPVGWEAWNILRIEAGMPWYGIDMDDNNLLPETGLKDRAVSYTKGCYVGQEVIARLHTYGSVSRKCMGLVIEGYAVPEAHDAIHKDGEVLGEITSACFSPALKQPIAMGYVKRPFYEAGTTVMVVHEGRPIVATLVKPPFVQSVVGSS